jgi:hypothetical protein
MTTGTGDAGATTPWDSSAAAPVPPASRWTAWCRSRICVGNEIERLRVTRARSRDECGRSTDVTVVLGSSRTCSNAVARRAPLQLARQLVGALHSVVARVMMVLQALQPEAAVTPLRQVTVSAMI